MHIWVIFMYECTAWDKQWPGRVKVFLPRSAISMLQHHFHIYIWWPMHTIPCRAEIKFSLINLFIILPIFQTANYSLIQLCFFFLSLVCLFDESVKLKQWPPINSQLNARCIQSSPLGQFYYSWMAPGKKPSDFA